MVEAGDVYKHFKGTEYVIIDIAICSETEERLVLYTEIVDLDMVIDPAICWEGYPIWSRPEKMFLEEITRDGKTFPRFQRVDDFA